YTAVRFGNPDIRTADRVRIQPFPDVSASPGGWHYAPKQGAPYLTQGNNMLTRFENVNWLGKKTGEIYYAKSTTDNFNFDLDLAGDPKKYVDAAISNVDYIGNYVHDQLYNYGFNEAAGNFQRYNPSRQGKEDDPVIALVQEYAMGDNSAFKTPPDGENGVLFMGLFGLFSKRDSSFDNTIILHELAHGLSNRLVGGAHQSDCLRSQPGRSIGEGISDFYATWATMKSTDTRLATRNFGEYADSGPMRKYPYSTNMKENPLTYKNIVTNTEVHAVGTIWATMLYEMYWNLVDTMGYALPRQDVDLTKGNMLALQLVINSLTTNSCEPDFIEARNQIIEAEKETTGGVHECKIWAAFAKRGLGFAAKLVNDKPVEDYSVPPKCQNAI
ncbi:peptidase M36, partial [Thamnocephalis sphaerospora]